MNTTHEILTDPKIRWQCRRGMLELDILLLSFFDTIYNTLDQEEKRYFVELLTFSDQELYGWLIGTTKPPASLQSIVTKIRHTAWKK